MSQLNIKGLVENIKARTNIYTPIVEAVVNSIQAIDDSGREDGEILITVKRSNQGTLDFALADISSIEIQDNGVGFNEIHRNSFDTLYSNLKIKKGGKGFGRFMFLKYFESVNVESIFEENGEYKSRKFSLGKNQEIIEREDVSDSTENDTKTTLFLNNLRAGKLDKKIETLAKGLLEKLLIYFINDDYNCPKISLKEEGKRERIVLNEYLSTKKNSEIQQVGSEEFTLEQNDNKRTEETFQVKIFKIFYPKNQTSKISLTAHNREVKETLLYPYVPEFKDDFYEDFETEEETKTRKDYMIKTYVLGDYLDSHVSLERGDFHFPAQNDLFSSFSQRDIERKAAEITKEIFKDEVKIRSEKKRERIKEYVENAPWHKEYFEELDMSLIPYKLTDDKIEEELHKAKFQQEKELKAKAKEIIENPDKEIDESVQELVEKISRAKMSDLTRYVALRKTILGLFKKSLEIQDNGRYSSENAVHSIIFPTRSDSDSTPYDHHNLWIIDEKLNFTQYISSDQPLNGGTSERTDLLIYNNQIVFRGDNEASNPITIFEFKKPSIDSFADHSAKEDPVQQIIRYVNSIKEGKHKTPKGFEISVGNNTPFYGFVVCTLTKKVKDWLFKEKGFKVMPDGEGWFYYHDNNNLYLEVISWDKMLKDAEMRNRIFFDKLGL